MAVIVFPDIDSSTSVMLPSSLRKYDCSFTLQTRYISTFPPEVVNKNPLAVLTSTGKLKVLPLTSIIPDALFLTCVNLLFMVSISVSMPLKIWVKVLPEGSDIASVIDIGYISSPPPPEGCI